MTRSVVMEASSGCYTVGDDYTAENTDPQYVGWKYGDLHVNCDTSPAVDRGNSAVSLPMDMDSNWRVDYPGVDNDGTAPLFPDSGAFECVPK